MVAEYIAEKSVEYVALAEHVLAESVVGNLDEYGVLVEDVAAEYLAEVCHEDAADETLGNNVLENVLGEELEKKAEKVVFVVNLEVDDHEDIEGRESVIEQADHEVVCKVEVKASNVGVKATLVVDREMEIVL